MVRVLLVLTAFAVLLYGCGQPVSTRNTPVQKQEKEHGVEQAAPKKPATKVQAVTEPAASKPAPTPEPTMLSTNASGAMSDEQAAVAETYCRMVTYASMLGMSQQEVSAFVAQTTQRSVKEMEDSPSLSAGAAGNEALDDLEVPRIAQCEVEGE